MIYTLFRRLLTWLTVRHTWVAQVSDSFPFEWIKKKWREGFHVTAMATAGPKWAVVMSRNSGFQAQCVELDFQYSSEGIHRRWDEGEDPRLRRRYLSMQGLP